MPPFQFQAPPDDYGKTIAQLIQEKGQQLAQGQSNAGQAIASGVQQVGQIAAAVPGQFQQEKAQQQEQQIRQLQLDNAKKAAGYQQATNQILTSLTTANPDGSHTLDRAKLQQQMAASNIPLSMQKDTFDALDEVDKSIAGFNTAKIDHMADLANGVIKAGGTPEALTTAAALAKANGLASDQQLAPVFNAVAGGADIKGLMTQIRGLSEKYKDAGKPVVLPDKAKLVNPEAAPGTPPIADNSDPLEGAYTINGQRFSKDGTPIGAVQPLQALPKGLESKSVLIDGKPAEATFNPADGKYRNAAGEDVSARVKPIPPASMQVNAQLVPSGDALSMAARRYLATGELPAMGMGQAGAAARVAVMNEAAKIDPQASLSANAATFKADSANLSNLQQTEGTLSAFENTAGKNLDQFLSLASKVPDTGVPWVNAPIRSVNAQVLGSADQAAFNAARDVALREIARVTSDPKLSGALTDSARGEIASLVPASATFAQIKHVAQVLKQDMANVHSGITDQIASVKSGLSSNPSAPSSAAKPVGRFNPVTGKIEFTDGR